jgi:hypothetical protein
MHHPPLPHPSKPETRIICSGVDVNKFNWIHLLCVQGNHYHACTFWMELYRDRVASLLLPPKFDQCQKWDFCGLKCTKVACQYYNYKYKYFPSFMLDI